MLDPLNLIDVFFDPNQKYKLKTDQDGKPILQEFNDIYNRSELIPYYHMTHVSKLFSLEPLEMGVMTTGISSIGSRTIKSIIREFKNRERAFNKNAKRPTNYTVNNIAQKLLNFIMTYYEPEFEKQTYKPELELMIGGYDKRKHVPNIYRIFVNQNKLEPIFAGSDPFGIAFGGQMNEIQRIVFGTDWINRLRLNDRMNILFNKYHGLLSDYLKTKGISEELPKSGSFSELSLFEKWNLNQFDANWGDFSNQNAIECVSWFVGIMIKSHEFRSHLPLVGGKIRIGLITKDKGFTFISNEGYIYEGHKMPMEDL